MKTLNERGQAFIHIMLGLALVGVIGSGAVTMIRSSQDEMAVFARKQGHLKLQEDLGLSLQRSDICKAVLHAGVFDVTAGSIPLSIDLPVGAEVSGGGGGVGTGTATAAVAGADLPDYDVHVDRLGVTFDADHPNLNPVSRGTVANGNQLWFLSVRLEAHSFPAGTAYHAVDLGPLYVETNGGTIQNCYGETDVATVARSLCEVLGGSFTPGHCAFKARLANVSCDAGAISSFTLSSGVRDCISVNH